MKAAAAFGGAGVDGGTRQGGQAIGQAVVLGDGGKFVVIQAGPAQALIFKDKTQGFDEMQFAAVIGAKADDVAGIGRDFRLE